MLGDGELVGGRVLRAVKGGGEQNGSVEWRLVLDVGNVEWKVIFGGVK